MACALICLLVLGEAKIKLAVFASAQRAWEQAGREIVSFFTFALLISLDQKQAAEMLCGVIMMMMANLSSWPTNRHYTTKQLATVWYLAVLRQPDRHLPKTAPE